MTTNDSSQTSSESSSDNNNHVNGQHSPVEPTSEELRQAFRNLGFDELREFVETTVMPSQLANEEMTMVILKRAIDTHKERQQLPNKTESRKELEKFLILQDFLMFLLYNAVKSFPDTESLDRLLERRLERFGHTILGEVDENLEQLLNKVVKSKNSVNYCKLQLEVYASAVINPIGTVHFLLEHLLTYPALIPIITQIFYDIRQLSQDSVSGQMSHGLLLSLLEIRISNATNIESLATIVQFIKELNKSPYKKSKVLITLEDIVRILAVGGRYSETYLTSKANQIFLIHQLIERNLNGKDKWTKADIVDVCDYFLYCIEVFANDNDERNYKQTLYVFEQLMDRHFPGKLNDEQFNKVARLCQMAGGDLNYLILLEPILPQPFNKMFTTDSATPIAISTK